MADVNNSRLIQLDHYIPSDWYTLITDPNRADHASNVFFHILPKKGRLNDTYQKLKTVPHLYTYLKEEIPEEFHYSHNRRVMPIFIVAEEGWTITKNKSKIDSHGNHGYSNQFPDMHPFFLAQGPAFKEGFVSEPFENVNIYSLMCHILGIEPAPNNGSLQAVQHLLKEKEQKHDYTVLIVVSVISVLVLLLMTYGIVSFCVKNHCRMRQYGHIYDLGTSELFDL